MSLGEMWNDKQQRPPDIQSSATTTAPTDRMYLITFVALIVFAPDRALALALPQGPTCTNPVNLNSCLSSLVAGADPFHSASATPTPTVGEVDGFPYSTTYPNGRVVAYATTLNFGFSPVYTGASTTIFRGQTMSVAQPTASSANVGTLTGAPLYTAVSSALLSVCTATPTSGAVTNCGSNVAKIDNIVWTDGDGDWEYDGKLELDIAYISYCDREGLIGMVSSLAAALKASSLKPGNKWQPSPHPCNDNPLIGCSEREPGYDGPIVNVPGFVDVAFEKDINNTDCALQQLVVNVLDIYPGGGFECADGALMTDTLAALALVPGLDFLSFMAIPALGLSVACTVNDNTG